MSEIMQKIEELTYIHGGKEQEASLKSIESLIKEQRIKDINELFRNIVEKDYDIDGKHSDGYSESLIEEMVDRKIAEIKGDGKNV